MESQVVGQATSQPQPNVPQVAQRRIKTALHQAVIDGRLHQVRLLVANRDVGVDSKDVYGRTALMLACLLDPEDLGYRMARVFFKAGAYIGTRDHLGRTALCYACLKGRERLVRRLLKDETVEVSDADNDGNSPLHHAATSGNDAVVHLLVQLYGKFGMSTDTRNSLGYTPLLLACKYGHFQSAHWLLSQGRASPALRDNEFFLNAQEWMSQSHRLPALGSSSAPSLGTRTCPDALSFSRKYSMYGGGPARHLCHHAGGPVHPLVSSLDSALQLPQISNRTLEDSCIDDGTSARQIVLKEIEDFLADPRRKPKASSSRPRRKHPATAKLLALDRRAVSAIDMRTLFKIYSEQYQEESVPKQSIERASTTGVRSGTGKSNPSITIKSFT